MQIGIAEDGILHHRDARDNGVDSLRALQWVGFFVKQQGRLKADEVCGMLFDIVFELFCRVFSCETVGIVIVGKQQHFKVHALLKQHICTAKCRMNACRITVIEQCYVGSETVKCMYLVNAQGRSGVCNDVFNAALVHGNHIRVAFNHVDTVCFCNRFLGLIDAVKLMIFVIDVTVWRVDILLIDAFCACIEHATPKANHLAAYAYPRKDDAT